LALYPFNRGKKKVFPKKQVNKRERLLEMKGNISKNISCNNKKERKGRKGVHSFVGGPVH
jgi:hypothetical protein